jgi:hypothetical protein
VNGRQTTAQQVADHLEEANIERYEAAHPVRLDESVEAIVVDAIRAAESRMRLELVLAHLSRFAVYR